MITQMHRLIIAGIVGWWSLVSAPAGDHLVKIGAVAGESGTFSMLNKLISMYSDGTIRAQIGQDSEWKSVDHNKSVSFQVDGETIRASKDNIPLAVTSGFEFCDNLNQVDISGSADRSVIALLPKGSRIKSIVSIGSGNTLLVYAKSAEAVHYPIWIELIAARGKDGPVVLGAHEVSADGDYCGMQAMGDDYRAVLVDEPSGSSDFASIYIYLVRP